MYLMKLLPSTGYTCIWKVHLYGFKNRNHNCVFIMIIECKFNLIQFYVLFSFNKHYKSCVSTFKMCLE